MDNESEFVFKREEGNQLEWECETEDDGTFKIRLMPRVFAKREGEEGAARRRAFLEYMSFQLAQIFAHNIDWDADTITMQRPSEEDLAFLEDKWISA